MEKIFTDAGNDETEPIFARVSVWNELAPGIYLAGKNENNEEDNDQVTAITEDNCRRTDSIAIMAEMTKSSRHLLPSPNTCCLQSIK